MNTFWKTIGEYNAATWIFQLLIIIAGIVLTIVLKRRQSRHAMAAMKIFLIFTYLWIAIGYYLICCSERSYNIVLAIFWCTLAAAWIWDLITGYTQLEYNPRYRILAYILLVMPLIYPVISIMRGLHFPEITSPVMPCSVVTFTIGLLLLFHKKVNLFIILLMCHWSLIGLSKTYFFGIPEDYILASASVPALYLFFKEYFLCDLHKDTKPKAKYINLLLIVVCVVICLILMGTMFYELMKDV